MRCCRYVRRGVKVAGESERWNSGPSPEGRGWSHLGWFTFQPFLSFPLRPSLIRLSTLPIPDQSSLSWKSKARVATSSKPEARPCPFLAARKCRCPRPRAPRPIGCGRCWRPLQAAAAGAGGAAQSQPRLMTTVRVHGRLTDPHTPTHPAPRLPLHPVRPAHLHSFPPPLTPPPPTQPPPLSPPLPPPAPLIP